MYNVNFLNPIYDNRQSFYGKAKTIETETETTLRSYDSDVAVIKDGQAIVKYQDYSQTTLRHIKEFLKQNGFKAETKKQIIKDYYIVEKKERKELYAKRNGSTYYLESFPAYYSESDIEYEKAYYAEQYKYSDFEVRTIIE